MESQERDSKSQNETSKQKGVISKTRPIKGYQSEFIKCKVIKFNYKED